MEVHAHAHTERKKLSHYLWEFVMLFLAVFCGFLAENIREHRVEAERGRQYIRSFCEDLRSDTSNINFQIDELTQKDRALSKIYDCFDSVTQEVSSTDCLKEIIINANGFTDFIYTDRTIQQLKYAGGLRLIRDQAIADSIIKYDATVRELQIHQQVLEIQQQNTIDAHNSMIGFKSLHHLNDPGMKSGPVLLTDDKREINKYFNEIAIFKRGCLGQLRWINSLKAMATRLLVFIKERTNE